MYIYVVIIERHKIILTGNCNRFIYCLTCNDYVIKYIRENFTLKTLISVSQVYIPMHEN